MTLDLRTLAAMLAASALLMSVVLCAGIHDRRAGGFMKWNRGLGLLAVGWLLVALRGLLPDTAAVAGANALLLAGFCLQLAAVAEFGEQSTPRVAWALLGPLLFAVLLLLRHNPAALTTAACLACAAALAGTGTAALRLAGGGVPRRMLMFACDAGAMILLVRAAAASFLPQPRPDLLAASAVDQAAFVGLFATSLFASVAFLLLHRERAEAGLQRLAAFDPLTEVFSRLAFLNFAESQLARARRSGEPCALLMLGLDRFKHVNRRFGHQAGDRVLREFAAVVRGALRAGDLVGRYDGEEFCVLLPNTAVKAALEAGERLRATIAARRLGGLAPAVTVSIGVAPCEVQHPGSLHIAIAGADQALQRAKEGGRDRVAGPVAAQAQYAPAAAAA